MTIRSLCVFCGSRMGADPAHARHAKRLGALLAANGIRLVYGGGGIGLMGVVAQAVLAGGGQVVGVIPDFLQKLEVGMAGLTELHVVETMHERKSRMFEMSDGFLVLPGGLGTLDETLEILTWRQLRQHDKPVIVVDLGGYWSALDALVARTIEGGFADPGVRRLYTRVERIEDILPALACQPAPAVASRADQL